MKRRLAFVVLLACALSRIVAVTAAADCDPTGNVRYICGVSRPEDLMLIPGTEWVIASGAATPGAIYLVNPRDRAVRTVYPANAGQRHDKRIYPACPGPLTPEQQKEFRAHGLNLRLGEERVHTLYVVIHGVRESVEVFELDARHDVPELTWIGCVIAPDEVNGNSVVPLPGGGIALTSLWSRTDKNARNDLFAGRPTGYVWEWNPTSGWKKIPGSEGNGPNGLEISKDGQTLYIANYGSSRLVRLPRAGSPKPDVAEIGFHVDNVRWAPDGSLLLAGHGGATAQRILEECYGKKNCDGTATMVAKVDPVTLKVRQLIKHPSTPAFISGTVAIQVGQEIWVGSIQDNRIAVFAAPNQ